MKTEFKSIQINSVCGFGSTGSIVVEISKQLSKNSIENYIYYGVGNSDYPFAVKFGGQLNVRSHQIKTRLLGKHSFYSKIATRNLIDKIKELKPDLIHLHNLHGHYLNVEILFKFLQQYNKPVIFTLHDCWSMTGHCAHFDYVGCEKWKTKCFNCPQLREYPKSLIFDRSQESYRDKKRLFTNIKNLTIVTPSDWLRQIVEKSFLKGNPVLTINSGIDLSIFKPIKSNFKQQYNIEDKFVILGVANIWTEKKGYNIFLKLANMIRVDEVIVLVGVTEEQKRKLPENIIGITRTESQRQLIEIYSASDVFLNPTLEEVLGLVNVESLSCGTPVITFDTGGSPETIDKSTGVIVKRDDIEALIDAKDYIKKILKEDDREQLKFNCIKRAEDYFDKDKKYSEYVKLYRRIKEGELN